MVRESPAARFYTEHRAELVGYAVNIVRDRALAEDVVQDAWLALARRREAVAVLDVRAYLRAAIRNLAIDALRRRVRERKIGGEEIDVAARQIPSDAPSPEAAVIARANLSCVMSALATLPERQRIAIEMYRLRGFKLREIAAQLGVSVPLVHLLISEGLALCAERCGFDPEWKGRD